FPEAESVIGKAGRADTPTDPSPLDMIETFINLRPEDLWPRRAMKFEDATRQTRRVLAALEERGYVQQAPAGDRDALGNDATMGALTQFDETMRALALQRYREFEHELGLNLTRFAVAESIRRFRTGGILVWPAGVDEDTTTSQLAADLAPRFGPWLARNPVLEGTTKLTAAVAQRLFERKAFPTWFQLTDTAFQALRDHGVPEPVVSRLKPLTDKVLKNQDRFQKELRKLLTAEEREQYQAQVVEHAAI